MALLEFFYGCHIGLLAQGPPWVQGGSLLGQLIGLIVFCLILGGLFAIVERFRK